MVHSRTGCGLRMQRKLTDMEYELKTTFNDVEFLVFYDWVDGMPEIEGVFLVDDPEGNDLQFMLSDTVLDGLVHACVAEEYSKLDEELERLAER